RRVRNQRRTISKHCRHRQESPAHRLKPLAPQTSQPEHEKRRHQKVNAGTWHSDHKPVIAAHVSSVRLKRERAATQYLNQFRRRREYPSQLVRGGVCVIKLERQSAQQRCRQLCAPDDPAIHTNHRFLRRIMIVASSNEPTASHTSSGSLPTSAPPTANSLTCIGNGDGCFTSSAVPVGLVTTSRTAMNDVYCVSRLYFKPSAVICFTSSSDTSEVP